MRPQDVKSRLEAASAPCGIVLAANHRLRAPESPRKGGSKPLPVMETTRDRDATDTVLAENGSNRIVEPVCAGFRGLMPLCPPLKGRITGHLPGVLKVL